jgi:hypothetical protein
MRNNDNLLLENLYQEGIWDRLKGQGAGIKQGAGTLMKNIGGKLTGDTGDRPSARTEYAKAQQSSLLKSFIQKVQKEIADFNNDLKLFKVDPNPDTLQKDFPIIAQRLEEIKNLEKFLTNPDKTTTSTQSTPKDSSEAPTLVTNAPKTAPTQETPTPAPTTQQEKPLESDSLLNPKDAAAYLKMSEIELQNLAATKKIKSKDGMFYVFDLEGYKLAQKNNQGEQPKKSQKEITPIKSTPETPTESPKKSDVVEYGLFKYVFDGKSWVVLSSKQGKTKKAEVIKNPDLIKKLNQRWTQEKNTKTKTTTKPSGVKRTETKVGQSKTRYTYKNESYNPFNEFLKECNLI